MSQVPPKTRKAQNVSILDGWWNLSDDSCVNPAELRVVLRQHAFTIAAHAERSEE